MLINSKHKELLHQASEIVRLQRDNKYFKVYDSFVFGWASILSIPHEIMPLLGANINVAIDLLFEKSENLEELSDLSNDLLALGNHTNAELFLDELQKVCDLRDAAKVFVSHITVKAKDIFKKNTELYNLWQEHWLYVLKTQNEHYGYISTLEISGITSYEKKSSRFDDALRYYVQKTATTSTLPLSLWASMVFSVHHEKSYLESIKLLIQILSPLYRTISDARIDLSEKMNMCIFALCVETQQDANTVIRKLSNEPDFLKEIENLIIRFSLSSIIQTEAKLGQVMRAQAYEISPVFIPLSQFFLEHAKGHLTMLMR